MRLRPTVRSRAADLSCPGRAWRDTNLGLARDRQLDDARGPRGDATDRSRQPYFASRLLRWVPALVPFGFASLHSAGTRERGRTGIPHSPKTRGAFWPKRTHVAKSQHSHGSRGGRRVRHAPHTGGCTSKADRRPYALRFSGTLPPLSASLIMTCWCSQTFISAEPSSAPV